MYSAQDARLKKSLGLKICILFFFFQNPEIIFYHIFCIFNLDFFWALILQKCIGSMYLYVQLLLHFQADPFETLHTLLGWSEDMYIVFFFRILKLFFITFYCIFNLDLLSASVALLDAPSNWRPGGRGFNPRRGWQHSFVEIDHEIFSMVILSLPLIQEGQLSVSGERMCTILVNRLED